MPANAAQPELTRAQFQLYRSLKRKPERLAAGLFLVEGIKNLRELLTSDFQLEALLHLPALEPASLLPHLPPCPRFVLPARRLDQLCETVSPEGIVAVVRLPRETPATGSDRPAVYLDGINDPGNLGTILRGADWFGLEPVYLSDDTADPYSGKVIRASMGSLFHLPLHRDDGSGSLLDELQRAGRRLVGLTLTAAQELHSAQLPPAPVLVMGSESHGLRPEVARRLDLEVRIPGAGRAESLNVAQAFTIAAYQLQVLSGAAAGKRP